MSKDINLILCDAAKSGDLAECQMAKDRGATDVEGMLREATFAGHEYICRLAIDWGAKRFDIMLLNSAIYKYENICRLAKDHLLKSNFASNKVDELFELMLCHAASNGNVDMCCLAKEFGAKDVNRMLLNSVSGERNPTIIDLAIKWGATNLNEALIHAAGSRDDASWHLLKEYAATDTYLMATLIH